jgi:hypothetical protein
MAQYLLNVYMVEGESYPSDEAMQQAFEDVDRFNAKLQAEGAWVFAGGLQPAEIATTVDGTSGELTVTDGPFAEAKEHVGGFWIIDVPDLDAALRWAAEGSRACQNKVEVRPFQDEPEA